MYMYQSTRSPAQPVRASQAIFRGLAPDGGLYTPVDFDSMRLEPKEVYSLSAREISVQTLKRLLDDFSEDELREIVEAGYRDKFETEDLTPLAEVAGAYVLELFRGPTCAFKDVALSLLPRLVTAAREKLGLRDRILVLTATSGDTGKAALKGFEDVPGTEIAVFYPQGGVSDVQRAQMVTQTGSNVHVCAVRGNFDDAQTGVKAIFAHEQEHGWARDAGVRLSSANSINLGRLAPQVAYYYKAYADLVRRGNIRPGDEVDFVVPTGNFGDILAGEFARRMGLPVGRLVCASNANRVLTDFIRTGRYDRRREFQKTLSPSMDILVSSNLERYLFLAAGGDWKAVADMMEKLRAKGVYTAPESVMREMRRVFWADCATDEEALEVIGRVFRETGYLMDTHTAVAWKVMERYRAEEGGGRPAVVLSTASPYKFPAAVLRALGKSAAEDGFAAMDALFAETGAPVPAPLAGLRDMPVRHGDAVGKEEMLEYIQGIARR